MLLNKKNELTFKKEQLKKEHDQLQIEYAELEELKDEFDGKLKHVKEAVGMYE